MGSKNKKDPMGGMSTKRKPYLVLWDIVTKPKEAEDLRL